MRFYLFGLLIVSLPLFAQNEEIDVVNKLFADAPAVILKNIKEYDIHIEKGKLVGSCKVHLQTYVNKESGIRYNSDQVSSSSFVEASNIKAATLNMRKNKVVKHVVREIEVEDDIDEGLFYDDRKVHKVVYPFVEMGSTLDFRYELDYKEMRFMGNMFFQRYIPVIHNELIIHVHKNVEINYNLFNCDSANIVFSKEENKSGTTYRWVRKNAKAVVPFANSPSFQHFGPHIQFYVTKYKVNNETHQLLGDASNLFSWYMGMQKNLNKTPDETLEKVVDSLLTGDETEIEKVRKVFYWVQDNISYVAIEDGLGGFIARDASLVCHRKYGDCKDMASIITEMLRIAGVKSYLTWIGSRSIPYTYADLPTPSADNHMIASYQKEDGSWLFLDATGKKAPLEVHTAMIQGKEALIGISPDSFLIVKVPVMDTALSQTIDSVNLKLENDVLIGQAKATLKGYAGMYYIYYTQYKNQKDYEDFFRSYFSKGNNKVEFGDVVKPIGNREDVVLTYDFKLPDYAKFYKNELYINMNVDNSFEVATLPEERTVPYKNKFKNKYVFVTTLEIPAGYKVDYIPENVSLQTDISGYKSSYKVEGNNIVYTSEYYLNKLLIPVADFETYNKVLKAQIKSNKQVVSLIKN